MRQAFRVALLTVLVTSCSGEAEVDPAQDGAGAAAAAPAERPESIQDTVFLEGIPEVYTARLFRAPEDFELPFSVYLPPAFVVEENDTDADQDGSALRFGIRFNDTVDPDAFIHVYVYPPGTQVSEVRGMARAFVESRGVPVSQGIEFLPPDSGRVAGYPWALGEQPYRMQAGGKWIHGNFVMGRHEGRYFHVVSRYPRELEEGIVPRFERMLASWEWEAKQRSGRR